MAAPIHTGSSPVFAAGGAKTLFAFRVPTFFPENNGFPYSVAADGQRFLVNTQVSTAEPTLNVIVNWEKAAAVKER
jgi:hypothetical protein